MSTEIYYFSGTGNSLYVAREIQKKIPDSRLIPIVSLLHHDVIQTKGSSIGIVFPVHALTIPIAVNRFLKKADISSAEYVFAVATRLGIAFNRFTEVEKILKKKHKRLNSHFILNMYSNDPTEKHYIIPTEEVISKLESKVQQQLNMIESTIMNRNDYRQNDSDSLIDLPYSRLINNVFEKFIVWCMSVSEKIGGVNYFCCDSKCTGCGICEKVCLSRKIKIMKNQPVWQKNVLCYMCYACINYCPMISVQINNIPGKKSFTRNNGRYTHPYASVKDTSAQKEI